MIIGENPKKVCNIESFTVNHVILKVNFQFCNFINLWKGSHMSSIPQHLKLFMTCNTVMSSNLSYFNPLVYFLTLLTAISLFFSLISHFFFWTLHPTPHYTTHHTLPQPALLTLHYSTLHYSPYSTHPTGYQSSQACGPSV